VPVCVIGECAEFVLAYPQHSSLLDAVRARVDVVRKRLTEMCDASTAPAVSNDDDDDDESEGNVDDVVDHWQPRLGALRQVLRTMQEQPKRDESVSNALCVAQFMSTCQSAGKSCITVSVSELSPCSTAEGDRSLVTDRCIERRRHEWQDAQTAQARAENARATRAGDA
jgi:hypothetical protein